MHLEYKMAISYVRRWASCPKGIYFEIDQEGTRRWIKIIHYYTWYIQLRIWKAFRDAFTEKYIVFYRNKTIAKHFCHNFLNTSFFNVTQVNIVGQPTESVRNHTQVDFAVILRPTSSSKPKVILNSTLANVVQESASSISKHLGGYQTVYVNNVRPPSDVKCHDDNNEQGKTVEKDGKTTDKKNALIIGTTISGGIAVLVIAFIIVAVWYRWN